MLSSFLKNLSILKKFLFINFIVFLIIGILTLVYLNNLQPSLTKDKTTKHIKAIDNTIKYLNILKIEFNEKDIRDFFRKDANPLIFLDRVQIFDNNLKLIGDTDQLDLDPKAFSQRFDVIEMNNLNEDQNKKEKKDEIKKDEKSLFIIPQLEKYINSSEFGKSYTFISF